MNGFITQFLIVSLLIFVTSCGERVENDVINNDNSYTIFEATNSVFDEYTERYKRQAIIYEKNDDISIIPINFYNLENLEGSNASLISFEDSHSQYKTDFAIYQFETEVVNAQDKVRVGVCIKYYSGKREILINETAWNEFSDVKKEILIFHELGHCALDREHDDSLYNNYKTSLMNSILIDENLYYNYTNNYIDELFTSDKTDIYRIFHSHN